LGTGGFGTVYAGKLPGKSVFAVKKIRHIEIPKEWNRY
jgi:hypothetical protein